MWTGKVAALMMTGLLAVGNRKDFG